ncbi:MAG: lipoyl domain-containing protein [Casimicrobiaceae bacterium]
MIYQLTVPGPIEDVDELRVLEWHGDVGHAFAPGQLVLELETHKAVVEVRAARPGVLRRILCAAGEWQRVGMPLALLSDRSEELLPATTEGIDAWSLDYVVV